MKDKVSKDPLIERIGTHGKFQLRAFLIIQFVGVFAGWQLLVSYMSRTCPSQNLQPSSISSRPEASSFPRLTTGAALLAWNWSKGRDRRQTLARDLRRTQQIIAWCMIWTFPRQTSLKYLRMKTQESAQGINIRLIVS